jgi:hypothetical protein
MTFTDIEKFCKPSGLFGTTVLTNIPGIKSLQLLKESSLNEYGQILGGATFYNIAFRKWSGSVSTKTTTARSGDYATKTASIYIPRHRFVVEKMVKQLRNQKVVVYITDQNDEIHRIDGARLTSEMSSDDSPSGSNGYRWTFTGQDRMVDYYINPVQNALTGDEYVTPEGETGSVGPDTGGPSVVDACCITILTSPIAYVPTPTGNLLHKNKVVTVAATGDKYFIDKNGIAILLSANGFTKERVEGTGAHIYTLSSTYLEDRVLVNRTQNVLYPDTPTLTNIDTFHIDGDQLILPEEWPLDVGEYIEIYKTA